MDERYPLKLRQYHWHFGLDKPLKVLHISDSHLIGANGSDKPVKHELAARRIHEFEHDQKRNEPGSLEEYFHTACRYARDNGELLVHTGDLIDYISAGALEKMRRIISEIPMIFTPGNHEYFTEIWPQYRDPDEPHSWEDVKKILPGGSQFVSHICNGVNFIAVDNAKYRFTAEQLAKFREEAAKKLPIVMLCHVQIHTPENYDRYFTPTHPCAYTAGCPVELMEGYPDELREEQKPDEATDEFIAMLKECKELRAILCGHHHQPFESEFVPGVIQRVVGGGYLGYACEYFID